jgi:hypothetical protein
MPAELTRKYRISWLMEIQLKGASREGFEKSAAWRYDRARVLNHAVRN